MREGGGKCILFSIPFDSSHVFSPLPAIFSIYFFIEVTSLFLFLFSFDSSMFSFLFSLSLPLSLTIRPNLNCLEFSAKPVSSVFPSHSCNLIALFGWGGAYTHTHSLSPLLSLSRNHASCGNAVWAPLERPWSAQCREQKDV